MYVFSYLSIDQLLQIVDETAKYLYRSDNQFNMDEFMYVFVHSFTHPFIYLFVSRL